MRTKLIYFVRHGETELNARGIRQGPDGPLSPKGVEQVKETAVRLPHKKGEEPQVLISSPFQRAKETAAILSDAFHLPVEYSDLLVERRNPSEIVGHSGKETPVKAIVDRIDKSYHDDTFRISDEENFVDLKDRAAALLRFIEKRSEKRLLMVTHSIFLRMVVSYMLLGKNLSASEYNRLSYLNPIDNAAVVICSYTKRLFRKPKWRLLVWNDIPQPQRDDDE